MKRISSILFVLMLMLMSFTAGIEYQRGDVDQNGVNGCLVTGSNGNTLFLPAAGGRWDDSLDSAGSDGCCWSRTLNSDYPLIAYSLYFYSGSWYWYDDGRLDGFAVRAVRVSQD